MEIAAKRSRSGRIFSPYEPWAPALATTPASAIHAAPLNVQATGSSNSSVEEDELTVLVTRLKFETFLKPAVQSELQRDDDAIGDCEGADLSSPPSPLLSPLPSPLTTPSSSANNSPILEPSLDPSELIPNLVLAEHLSIKNPAALVATAVPNNSIPSFALTPVPSPHPTPSLEFSSSQSARQLPSTLTQRQKAGKKARQAKKRAQELDPLAGRVRSSLSQKWMQPHAFRISWSAQHLSAAKGGFVAIRYVARHQTKPWTLQELQNRQFRVIRWDGCAPYAIVDDQNRVIVMLCGRPRDGGWDAVVREMTRVLLKGGQEANLKLKDLSHRRGYYPALSSGVSYGGGQTIPSNLHNSHHNRKVVDGLLDNWAMKRVAGFGSSQYAYYFPKIYQYYSKNLRKLFNRYPHLRHNFMNSIFPACTFNMGQNTVALEHADTGNLAAGGCPVTSGGDYNPKLGGHMVLFSLGIAVEFPPGSTIIIPSSTLPHGNTAIQPGETRVSFTQYCAGGLHRWVEYGYQSVKSCTKEIRERMASETSSRWLVALNRFSKVDELHKDRIKAFQLK